MCLVGALVCLSVCSFEKFYLNFACSMFDVLGMSSYWSSLLLIGGFHLIVVNFLIVVLESGCVLEKSGYVLICTRIGLEIWSFRVCFWNLF